MTLTPARTALLAAADISESPPFDALARVGVRMVEETI